MGQRKLKLFESLQIKQFSFDQAEIFNIYAPDSNLNVLKVYMSIENE